MISDFFHWNQRQTDAFAEIRWSLKVNRSSLISLMSIHKWDKDRDPAVMNYNKETHRVSTVLSVLDLITISILHINKLFISAWGSSSLNQDSHFHDRSPDHKNTTVYIGKGVVFFLRSSLNRKEPEINGKPPRKTSSSEWYQISEQTDQQLQITKQKRQWRKCWDWHMRVLHFEFESRPIGFHLNKSNETRLRRWCF